MGRRRQASRSAHPKLRCRTCRWTFDRVRDDVAAGDRCPVLGDRGRCAGILTVGEKPYRPPGSARPIFVDVELQRADLDRINDLRLPGLTVDGTCAGHLLPSAFVEWDNPRPWMEFSAPLSDLDRYVKALLVYGAPSATFIGWRVVLSGYDDTTFWFGLEAAKRLFGKPKAAARWWTAAARRLSQMAKRIRDSNHGRGRWP